MVQAGNLIVTPEMIDAMAGPLANSILYMFTWGGASNWGTALQALIGAVGAY
ncbi:hypothetical protein QSJ18_10205 [Gordonia sp. ABSL1-1]|uniref:hypothetical protein n=1 Tax=Gordonia sp. ABSL1-1 TaxID=3053923 RepID=UPI002573C16B|nr:hypothetical protein [Gordonia sp. ABSL1-1]MDL9937114.1 hypothetical protein [Gordonia sp. ABSL1-1]